jgi:putative FmdB family regulatory protein
MPLFEYRCTTCGRTLEILQPSSDPARLCGPHCVADPRRGDGELERLISVPAPTGKSAVSATGKLDYGKAKDKGFKVLKKDKKGQYKPM